MLEARIAELEQQLKRSQLESVQTQAQLDTMMRYACAAAMPSGDAPAQATQQAQLSQGAAGEALRPGNVRPRMPPIHACHPMTPRNADVCVGLRMQWEQHILSFIVYAEHR